VSILPGDVGFTFASIGTHRGVTPTCRYVPVLSLSMGVGAELRNSCEQYEWVVLMSTMVDAVDNIWV